jgi:hypothetical protein
VLDELVESSPRLPAFGPQDDFSRLDARLREDERLHEVAPDIRTREIIFKRAFVLRLIVAARLWMMIIPKSAAGAFAAATS